MFNPGDRVEFTDPEPGENKFPMYVVEDRENRALIQIDMPGWFIKPTQVVKSEFLVRVQKEDS